MKKRFLVSILFLITASFAFSQDGKIKLSPEYKLAKNKVLAGHLHSTENAHYMYFYERKGLMGGKGTSLILEKYGARFNQKFSKTFKTDKKNIFSLNMKYFKGKFAWLMYEKNKGDDYLEFFLTPIDLKGKASKPKSIAKFKFESRKDFPSIRWQVSSDTSRILFLAESDLNSKKDKYEVYLSVIDNEFNTIWEKQVKLPFSQKRVRIKNWELADDGTVYFVAKIYEDDRVKESKKRKKKSKTKQPAYDMVIYSMDGEKDKPAKYELKLNDAFVKGVKLRVDESNDLTCVGFFGDSKSGPTQGVFYLKLSGADGSTIFANKRRFTAKELVAFGDKNTSKDKKSKDSGLDQSFKFDDIVVLDNGAIFATAEESYSYTTTSRDSRGNITYRTVYVSNSIVVINIDPSGKVSNIGIIPKKQKMSSRTYQSYAMLRSDDNIYFIYNDDKDNIRKNITDPDKIKRISSAKDCVAVMTSLNKNNKMKREQLFTKKEAKTLMMPSKSVQISKNKLFFFNSKPQLLSKSKFRFGTLELK